jgi:hypothetical protein
MPTVNAEPTSNAAAHKDASIPAELLAAIAAAAAVFVGKRLRILSLTQLDSTRLPESRWSRQGRVLVQSSHNLPVKHMAKSK